MNSLNWIGNIIFVLKQEPSLNVSKRNSPCSHVMWIQKPRYWICFVRWHIYVPSCQLSPHPVIVRRIYITSISTVIRFVWLPLPDLADAPDTRTANFATGKEYPLIARFMGPTWGPSGTDRSQVGHILAPWTLLSGLTNMLWLVIIKFILYGVRPIALNFCEEEHIKRINDIIRRIATDSIKTAYCVRCNHNYLANHSVIIMGTKLIFRSNNWNIHQL